jgi:ATP-binding cassette subfamily C (CFTR/MRP) protein 1
VATLPFTISICFGLLFYYLGLTFFAGIGIFIVSMILNICLSRILARFQKQYMARQDLRISSTTELLNNIKMIKLYAWVDIFKNVVFQRRTAELNLQFKRMNVLMLTMASLTFAPLFLQTASFSLFIGLGQSLNLAVAYTVLTIFQQIQSPIRWLPMFIGQLIEFTVAMGRIQNFLGCDEINETIVHKDPNRIEAVSIQGNYHWGLEVEKAKQSKPASKR